MINLLQRVSQASVSVDGERIAAIDLGLLVMVGFESGDVAANESPNEGFNLEKLQNNTKKRLDRMADRLLAYRVFPDRQDRMNLNVVQAEGALLLIPQFTLAADTSKGLRPGFHTAAPPEQAKLLFDRYLEALSLRYPKVQQGRFGADMQVSLVNNGPVTFWLQL